MSSVNSTLTRLSKVPEYSLAMQQDLWMQDLEIVLSQDLNGISILQMLPFVIVHLQIPPIQTNLLGLAIRVRHLSNSHPFSSAWSLSSPQSNRAQPKLHGVLEAGFSQLSSIASLEGTTSCRLLFQSWTGATTVAFCLLRLDTTQWLLCCCTFFDFLDFDSSI